MIVCLAMLHKLYLSYKVSFKDHKNGYTFNKNKYINVLHDCRTLFIYIYEIFLIIFYILRAL